MRPSDPPPGLPNARELRGIAVAVHDRRRHRHDDEREARRRLLEAQFDQFLRAPVPSGALEEAAENVRRAAAAGDLRCEIFRFPSEYCRDSGRAVNNGEPDWPATLQGLAERHYLLIRSSFGPLDYHLSAEIVSWPQLMPGDVGVFLGW